MRVNGRDHSNKARFGEFCSLWVVTQPDIGEGLLFKYRLFANMDEDESGRVTATELAAHMKEKNIGMSEEVI